MSTKADWMAAKAELDAIEEERNELLKPTNDRYCAAQERLELIEDECGELLDHCGGCGKPIFDGEKVFDHDDGPSFCEECAPTYAEMLSDPSRWFSYDDDGEQVPMTPERAQAICNEHISSGGALTDSMAR